MTARLPGEDFDDYRIRRAKRDRYFKERLAPRMVHTSTEPVFLPALGVDAEADRAVLDGKIRDVKAVTLPGGTEGRIGRTKGVTYRRPSA